MRITIGNKIFAIAASMTMIVAVTSTISAYFVSSVNNEVERVANTYIPLSQAIEDIENHILEQEILFERLIPQLRAGHDLSSADKNLQGYKSLGQNIQAEFKKGTDLLARAESGEDFVEFKVDLARLGALLSETVLTQQSLEGLTGSIFERVKAGGLANIDDMLAHRLSIDENLARQIKTVHGEVGRLTKHAADHAADDEVWALRANITATAAAALFGLIMAGLIARGLVRPIRSLESAALELKRGNLSPKIEVLSKDEIGHLAMTFGEMATELRFKEQIVDTFGKYVDPRVVKSLTTGEDAGLGNGERRVYSVFFSDIAGFTGISEKLTPQSLVKLINAYLTDMSKPIQESQGVIDKYIGDAIMAYWGPPFTPEEQHAHLACHAALLQQNLMSAFRERVSDITGLRKDVPDVSMRIGIATGPVLVGSVGSDTSRNYTVIGDTVNLAARLESLCKFYGTSILIDERTWLTAGDQFETREIDTIAVAGKTEAVRIFELMAEKDALSPERAEVRERYIAALESYRGGDWKGARQLLMAFAESGSADGPVRVLLNRLNESPDRPDPGWDGVWRFSQK